MPVPRTERRGRVNQSLANRPAGQPMYRWVGLGVPMNHAQPRTDRYYSREGFRRWCEAQTKGRYERVDGWIVVMAPDRGAHLRVKGPICKAPDRAVTLASVPYQALPDGATVETGGSELRTGRRVELRRANGRRRGRGAESGDHRQSPFAWRDVNRCRRQVG